jgi:hypothetical protein
MQGFGKEKLRAFGEAGQAVREISGFQKQAVL